MSCAQANVNKRNINTLVASLQDSLKKNQELSEKVDLLTNKLIQLEQELNNVKQIATRSIGTGAST